MKNLIVVFVLFLALNVHSLAQVTNVRNDYNVYSDLLAQYNDIDKVPIYKTTSTTILKKYDFKNNDFKSWWGIAVLSTDQKQFLNRINVDFLKDYDLPENVGNHLLTSKTIDPFLTFSPVIYSNSKKLAICALFDYTAPEASSETIYLLEFQGVKWTIIKFVLVSIS